MAVADLGEVPAPPPTTPYFWTKLRPEGPKKIFLETTPPPLLSQGLDDRLPLSEDLDPPLYEAFQLNRCHSQAA